MIVRYFSWIDDETGKRRYRYFSIKHYGDEGAKLKAREEQQKMMNEKRVNIYNDDQSEDYENFLTTKVAGTRYYVNGRVSVNYNERTGYWRTRDRDRKSVCFSVKQFGYEGGCKLAHFAKDLIEGNRNHNFSREEIFEQYEKKYGTLPIRGGDQRSQTSEVRNKKE